MTRSTPSTPRWLRPVTAATPWHMPPWALALMLVTLAVLAHGSSVRNGFIWDDDFYVTDNQTLRSPAGLREIWIEPRATPQYYPLVHTSYWIEYRLWGLHPAGYHAVNVAIHAASSVVLWGVLSTLAVPGAWWAAALFAVHPVGVETVAWVTERKNTLSLLFALGAAWCWLRYRFGPGPVAAAARDLSDERSRRPWLAAAVALFACALLSKTVAAMLVGVLAVIVWWKTGTIRRADVVGLLPLVMIGLPLALLTIWLEKHHVGAGKVPWNLSFADRLLIAGRAPAFYASKLAWPSALAFFYPRWIVDVRTAWQWLFPLVFMGGLAAAWRSRAAVDRAPCAVLAMYACCLFPALGFFDVYPFKYSFVADHFQYHAMPVLLAAAAAGVTILTPSPRLQRLLVGGTLTVLATASFLRCGVFFDLETLYRDTLDKNPTCAAAAHNLGMLFLCQGRQREGEALVRLGATHALFADEKSRSLTTLGLLALRRGQTDAAVGLATEAVRIDSTWRSRGILALALVRAGRTDEARPLWEADGEKASQEMRLARAEAALQEKDLQTAQGILADYIERATVADRPDALLEAGIALATHSFPVEAEHLLATIDGVGPVRAKAAVNIGICRALRSRWAAAIDAFREAVRLDPGSVEAHANLGKALAALGRRDEALAELQTARQLSGGAFAFQDDYERILNHSPNEAPP
jgi:Flp pilus assembly protein TadD